MRMPAEMQEQINELQQRIAEIRFRHLEQMEKEIAPLISVICDAKQMYPEPICISQEQLVSMGLLNLGEK